MASDSYNRLPAGLMTPPSGSAASSSSIDSAIGSSDSGGSSLPLILSVIALLLGAGALYLELTRTIEPAVSAQDREAIRTIAANLRSMQQKEFVTTSPDISTTVTIDKSFPLSEVMPANSTIPVSADIPIQTTVSAISQSGQVTSLRINDTLRIRAQIPVNFTGSSDQLMVRIHQDVPVNTRIRGSFKFSNVFPSEFNTIIQKLEQLGESATASG